MTKRGENWKNRHDQEFKDYLLKYLSLNKETGLIDSKIYVSIYVTIKRRQKAIAIPYAHLVWFLENKRWPNPELILDHKDENSLNNRLENLREITHAENQARKRGKGNSQYGSSKYGHGIAIYKDKRNGKYIAERYISSKIIKERKDRYMYLFRSDTLEGIELKIKKYIDNNFVKEVKYVYDALSELDGL